MSIISSMSILSNRSRSRGRMRDFEARREDKNTNASGWDSLARENMQESSPTRVNNERDMARQEAIDPIEELRQLRRTLAEKIVQVVDSEGIGWARDSIFSNAPLGETESYSSRKSRLCKDAFERLEDGQGYKDIKLLKKIMRRHKKDELKCAGISATIEDIRKLDTHGGMTPREYGIAQNKLWQRNQQEGTVGREKATVYDLHEAIGERVLQANEKNHDNSSRH